MNLVSEPSWFNALESEYSAAYFANLTDFVDEERRKFKVFPSEQQVFSAFNLTSFDSIRVVILGQDPYHGIGQANGLAFSVYDGVKFPPSLRNIFKEIQEDCDLPIPLTGNLERWAKQGVLLLNSVLTVREGNAGSHANKGWEIFTDAVIRKLSEEKDNLCFMLWGDYARKKGRIIDGTKHLVLQAGHPSPMSANQGKWFGNKHFSQCNAYQRGLGLGEIDWS